MGRMPSRDRASYNDSDPAIKTGGILALLSVLLPPLAIVAIVFAAIGMGRGAKGGLGVIVFALIAAAVGVTLAAELLGSGAAQDGPSLAEECERLYGPGPAYDACLGSP
jgi:hypothetical protein